MTELAENDRQIELQESTTIGQTLDDGVSNGITDEAKTPLAEEESRLKSPSWVFFHDEYRPPSPIQPPLTPPSQTFFHNQRDSKPPVPSRSPLFNVVRKPKENLNSHSTLSSPLPSNELKKFDHLRSNGVSAPLQNTITESGIPLGSFGESVNSDGATLSLESTSEGSRDSDSLPKSSTETLKNAPVEKEIDRLTSATVLITPQCTVQFKCADKTFFKTDETEEKNWKPSKERRLSSVERDFIPTNLGNWRLVGYRPKSDIDETKDLLLVEKRNRRFSVPAVFVVGKTKETETCRLANAKKSSNSVTHVVTSEGRETTDNPKLAITPLDSETKKKVMMLLHKTHSNKKSSKPKQRQSKSKNTARNADNCCPRQSSVERKKFETGDVWRREYQKLYANKLKKIKDKKTPQNSNSIAVKDESGKPLKKTVFTPFSFLQREEEFVRKKEMRIKRDSQVKKYEIKKWARPAPVFRKKPAKPPSSKKPITVPLPVKLETDDRLRKWDKFLKECAKKHRKLERERKHKEELEVKEIRKKAVPEIHDVPYEDLGITPRKEPFVSLFRKLREEYFKVYSPFLHGKREDPKTTDSPTEQNITERENQSIPEIPPDPEPVVETSTKGDKRIKKSLKTSVNGGNVKKSLKGFDNKENTKNHDEINPTANVAEKNNIDTQNNLQHSNTRREEQPKIPRFSGTTGSKRPRNNPPSKRVTCVKKHERDVVSQKYLIPVTQPVQAKKKRVPPSIWNTKVKTKA